MRIIRSTTLLTFFLFVLCFQSAYSQIITSEKRIYLLDVTKSMIGQGVVPTPDIFNQVKQNLLDAIDEIEDPKTEIVIVPFTNKTYSAIVGNTAQKDSLKREIAKIEVKSGDTNIADAWSFGISLLDSTKVNYMFLLTDGLHNSGPSKEVLYEKLREWDTVCKGKYYFSFYVMLTSNAVEQEIRQIANNTKQMWSIESLNINAALIKTDFVQRFNIFEDKTIGVTFSSNNPKVFLNDLDVQFVLENNYVVLKNNSSYTISQTRQRKGEPSVYEFDVIELQKKIDIPVEVMLKIKVSHNEEKYPLVFFTPNELEFKIINRGVRRMTLKVVEDEK